MKYLILINILIFAACSADMGKESSKNRDKEPVLEEKAANDLIYKGEKHFADMVQLTSGGENAEAYWSFDNTKLVFQRTNTEDGLNCDQIFYGPVGGLMERQRDFMFTMISTGKGKTTCSYFLPGNEQIIYASTHLDLEECPPKPERSMNDAYVWQIHPEFELFTADLSGNIVKQLTDNNFYDAEATVSPKGDKIIFTSDRSGDLELFTMNIDGSMLKQITNTPGYDGGAFFSPDGSKIVWRASRPGTDELKQYNELLSQHLVSPTSMEIYIANADGSDVKQVTDLGGANWAPFFHPSGEKIIFCSNHHSGGFPFNLFIINVDGSGLEQITFDTAFDSFPMFSFDGKYLSFSSNRNNGGTRNTNLFIAKWQE